MVEKIKQNDDSGGEDRFAARMIELFETDNAAEIARRLEVPQATVNNYLRRGRLPDAWLLRRIARKTGCSLNWLLLGDGAKFLPRPTQAETVIPLAPKAAIRLVGNQADLGKVKLMIKEIVVELKD